MLLLFRLCDKGVDDERLQLLPLLKFSFSRLALVDDDDEDVDVLASAFADVLAEFSDETDDEDDDEELVGGVLISK